MAKQTRSLIGTALYKKVGELEVTFGHLEDCFRYLVAGHLSPGIDGTICQGLFCRVRFAELVDMYLMVCGFVIDEAEMEEWISEGRSCELRSELKAICKLLSRVNERRNTIVHSTYFEEEVDEDGGKSAVTLWASKPNRNALDLTEDFNPFDDVIGEIGSAIPEIDRAYQELLRFDWSLLPQVNQLWTRFSERVLDMKQRGIDLSRARLQFPGLRIGYR